MKITKKEWKLRHKVGMQKGLDEKIKRILGNNPNTLSDYEILSYKGLGKSALMRIRENRKD